MKAKWQHYSLHTTHSGGRYFVTDSYSHNTFDTVHDLNMHVPLQLQKGIVLFTLPWWKTGGHYHPLHFLHRVFSLLAANFKALFIFTYSDSSDTKWKSKGWIWSRNMWTHRPGFFRRPGQQTSGTNVLNLSGTISTNLKFMVKQETACRISKIIKMYLYFCLHHFKTYYLCQFSFSLISLMMFMWKDNTKGWRNSQL